MGGKKRSKFDRIYTDSEAETSDDEDTQNLSKLAKTEEINTGEMNQAINENNSNSTRDGQNVQIAGTISSTQNDKFLVTRSKRKYDKPVLKRPINAQKAIFNEEVVQPVKRKRETIKSLDSKIQDANNFLAQLSKKIDERDNEIKRLKSVITENRSHSPPKNSRKNLPKERSEIERILTLGDSEKIDDISFHDFPLTGNEESSDEEIFPVDRDEIDSAFQESERNKSGRKRSRSRSKSRDRSKRRKNRKSRSRSRNREPEVNAGIDHDKAANHDNTEYARKQLEGNPGMQELVKKMVAEQVQHEIEKRQKLDNTSGMELDRSLEKLKLKSNSDTTLYRPAIARVEDNRLNGTPSPCMPFAPMNCSTMNETNMNEQAAQTYNYDTINDGLSYLRYIADAKGDQPSTSRRNGDRAEERRQKEQINDARKAAESAILQAERYKARIQQPNKGMNNGIGIQFNNFKPNNKQSLDELRAMRYLDSEDDEFFHTTCHIEDAIREKIEKGKFIELEKLIQKRILQYDNRSDNRMQLVNRDGISYFVPAIDRETKIDNIKKWEQAFRVYTTIYCKANPNRAGEILQYVDVIHRAAAIFNWDNVAKYDYVFRQLMAEKPHRSWAKVYTQMWNITLNEPIKKFNEHSTPNKYKANGNGQNKRESFCWKYNKNACTYGKSCKFEHKCSYCGVKGHPVLNCHKKHGKKGDRSEKGEKKQHHSQHSSSS